MPPEESPYPADWLRIAEKDLSRVERALRDDDPEAAGFFLQQALEKSLKAFLLAGGWKLRRIHDLEILLDEAVLHDPTVESFRETCRKITDYYLLDRYPLLMESGPTTAEVRHALETGRALMAKIREAMRHG